RGAIDSVDGCILCDVTGAPCPADAGVDHVQHLLSEGQDPDDILDQVRLLPRFATGTAAARDQQWSRNGFHAVGYLARVLALAGDSRLAEPELMLQLKNRHIQRRTNLLKGKNGGTRPETHVTRV